MFAFFVLSFFALVCWFLGSLRAGRTNNPMKADVSRFVSRRDERNDKRQALCGTKSGIAMFIHATVSVYDLRENILARSFWFCFGFVVRPCAV